MVKGGVSFVLWEGQKGFTLVEVVVALLLLSIVTVVVVQIYNSGFFCHCIGWEKDRGGI